MPGFEIVSDLAADAAAVWRHAVSPAGINRELRPILRMTFPPGVTDVVASWRPGAPPVRSWMLLGGVLPVEYDDLSFAAVEPGRRFLERSVLLSQRVWEHERLIEPTAGGCRVTDRLRFESRVALTAPISAAVVGAVFRLRHRNLRRLFGGVA